MSAPADRAAPRRKDGEALEAALGRQTTVLVPTWRNKNLVSHGRRALPVTPTVAEAPGLVAAADEVVFLGVEDGVEVFAVDLSSTDDPLEALGLAALGELRELIAVGSAMPARDRRLLMYARAMMIWHRDAARCPRCGEATRAVEGGHARKCGGCERVDFPRTDPAVMIAIERDDRLLLARQPTFPPGMYSVLAGFVEPGESVEECVVREAREEVGLELVSHRYVTSQPWPFPRSLMLGFRCVGGEGRVRLDEDELEDFKWVTREELEMPDGFFTPPPISLAHRLIQDFREGR